MKKILFTLSLGLLLNSNLFGLTEEEEALFMMSSLSEYKPDFYNVAIEALKTIKKPIDEIKNKKGNTPLHTLFLRTIANKKKLKFLRLLIENSNDINVKNQKGETPLYLATLAGYTSNLSGPICLILLNEGAKLSKKDHLKAMKKPFYQAAYIFHKSKPGRYKYIKNLLEYDYNIKNELLKPYYAAMKEKIYKRTRLPKKEQKQRGKDFGKRTKFILKLSEEK